MFQSHIGRFVIVDAWNGHTVIQFQSHTGRFVIKDPQAKVYAIEFQSQNRKVRNDPRLAWAIPFAFQSHIGRFKNYARHPPNVSGL